MATTGKTVSNPLTGERITWLETAADTRGAYLKFRLDVAPLGLVPVEHIHPEQDERFEIHAGSLELLMEGRRRVLHAGDSFMVPKGARHQWWNRSETTPVVMDLTFTPALNTETMFEQLWGRVADGKCEPDGGPRLVDALAMLHTYHIFPAGPPVWLQRAISIAFASAARLFGYRMFRPEYSPDGPSPFHNEARRTGQAGARMLHA
ncbi:MAG TPA: cupin domain-containing protein [Flavobacteriales bacterium]|nr:cupin domain-containing protein [Flavobacteriales bacterium]